CRPQILLRRRTRSPWRRILCGARPGKADAVSMTHAWAGISSSCFLVGSKLPVSALRKKQRFIAVVRIVFDRAEEDHMITTLVSIDGAALKIRDAFGKKRRTTKSRRPLDTDKFVIRRFRKPVCERLLRYA